MTPNTRRGVLTGLAIGLSDLLLMQLLDVRILWEGHNIIVLVLGIFTATFATLGYANGRLMDAREELERTQADKLQYEKLASIGQMAATVAHEVRNPLGVIKSASALIAESLPAEDEEGLRAGRFIVEEIDRLDGFVRSLLDYARPIVPDRGRHSLTELAERVERLTAGIGVTPRFEIANEEAELDLELMTRAVAAVVDNACRSASSEVVVRVGAGEIVVDDDGDGIDPSLGARIFEPFVTGRTKGTGLGLPLAQRIVQAHGGSLGYERAPGGGTRFTFRFEAETVLGLAA